MSSGAWATVYDMAAKRDSTNMGEDHLSKHSLQVLHTFMTEEVQQTIAFAFGFRE